MNNNFTFKFTPFYQYQKEYYNSVEIGKCTLKKYIYKS